MNRHDMSRRALPLGITGGAAAGLVGLVMVSMATPPAPMLPPTPPEQQRQHLEQQDLTPRPYRSRYREPGMPWEPERLSLQLDLGAYMASRPHPDPALSLAPDPWSSPHELTQVAAEPVPEPATGLLLTLGLAALARRGRRERKICLT